MKKEKNNKKKSNPIVWFLFAVIIPLVVIIGLIVVILSFTNFSTMDWVKEKGKDIPVISSFIPSEEEKNDKQAMERAEETIAKQKDEITDLHEQITNLESIIDELEQDIIKLENKYESEDSLLEEGTEVEERDTIKTMSASFRKMKSKQAALIFQDLEVDIALEILEQLPNDTRGGILEAMEPKKAAQLTEMFIKKNE